MSYLFENITLPADVGQFLDTWAVTLLMLGALAASCWGLCSELLRGPGGAR